MLQKCTGSGEGSSSARELHDATAAGRKLEGHGVIVRIATSRAREDADAEDQRVAGAGGEFEGIC